MNERLMTLEDVAAYLAVPKATIYVWNTKGVGPKYSRVGRFARYRKSDVDAWLESNVA